MDEKMSGPVSRIDTFRQGEAALTPDMETYKGLVVHALTGLHAHAAGLAARGFPPGGRVLDMAAGSGAFALRLTEAGFAVTASDLATGSFRLADRIPFLTADLNVDGPEHFPGPFDAVTALEIIEHLENPWDFTRKLHALLKPGGRLLLTTPNVEAPIMVERWLRRGQHPFFDEEHFRKYGHITPVTQYMLTRMLEEAGFRDIRLSGYGTEPPARLSGKKLRQWLLNRWTSRGPLVRELVLIAEATA
ncbi:class I SAM-dependent methyltransferase [Indioceanicola profundi]|uniref:class I SAM-dependent methyltransferase n=1 Tax=Indioceanicola profundi TaxID=2220096 RepID=UPI0013C4F648|nr:methyltransferase domain-containing protein [Indioceanicola profundi]